jgi:hypothetical protein
MAHRATPFALRIPTVSDQAKTKFHRTGLGHNRANRITDLVAQQTGSTTKALPDIRLSDAPSTLTSSRQFGEIVRHPA